MTKDDEQEVRDVGGHEDEVGGIHLGDAVHGLIVSGCGAVLLVGAVTKLSVSGREHLLRSGRGADRVRQAVFVVVDIHGRSRGRERRS